MNPGPRNGDDSVVSTLKLDPVLAFRSDGDPPGCAEPTAGVAARNPAFLLADPEPVDQLPVALRILRPEVVEEATAVTDHLEESAPGVVILGKEIEMLSQVLNPLTEDGDLDFRGAGVGGVGAVGRDDFGFPVLRQSHPSSPPSSPPRHETRK